jgi:hypothetical protein
LPQCGQLRLHTLWRLLPEHLAGRLGKWVEGWQYAVLFDHAEDTLHLSHFVAFDLQGVDEHEEIIEPLLYWILRQVKNVVHDPALMGTFKLIMMDELWKHLKNPTVVEFADLMIKTGRKHLVGAIRRCRRVQNSSTPPERSLTPDDQTPTYNPLPEMLLEVCSLPGKTRPDRHLAMSWRASFPLAASRLPVLSPKHPRH